MRTNQTFLRMAEFPFCLVIFSMLLCSGKAGATGILYQFDNVFSGSTPPAGSAPWIDATFQDTNNGVLLTMNNIGLTGSEFVSEWDFNVNPNFSASQIQGLQFSLVDSNGNFAATSIMAGEDIKKADGDGYYDINFNFSTAASSRFGAGDYLTYLITGITGLTAADFAYLSSPGGGNGPFYSAAHIQGIGSSSTSVWVDPSGGPIPIPVPEPASWALLAASFSFWSVWRLRSRRPR